MRRRVCCRVYVLQVNLLPTAIVITLTRLPTGKSKKKNGDNRHHSEVMLTEEITLEKGERCLPPIDVRAGVGLSVAILNPAFTSAKQKRPAVIWPSGASSSKHHKPESMLKLVDSAKRLSNRHRLTLRLNHLTTPGKPTSVSIFATHWVVNETGLPLEYFDVGELHFSARPLLVFHYQQGSCCRSNASEMSNDLH